MGLAIDQYIKRTDFILKDSNIKIYFSHLIGISHDDCDLFKIGKWWFLLLPPQAGVIVLEEMT